MHKKCFTEKVQIFHILTNTDSTALQFIFISDRNSDLPEEKFRDLILEVIVKSKIYQRFDSSHKFWDIFGARKTNKKKSDYYEIENIDNHCIITLAVNPNEYLQVLKNNFKIKSTK